MLGIWVRGRPCHERSWPQSGGESPKLHLLSNVMEILILNEHFRIFWNYIIEASPPKPPHRSHPATTSPTPLHWKIITETAPLKPRHCNHITETTPLQNVTDTTPLKKTITGTAPPKPQHCKHITEVTTSAQPHHFTEATSAQLLHWRHSIYDITDWHRLFKKNRWNCSTDTISLQPHPWNHWTETTSPQPLDWNPFTETIRTAICSFWWMFLTEISLSPLQFAVFEVWQYVSNEISISQFRFAIFEECLTQNLHFHIFNLQFWKDVSHESVAFTSSSCSFWRMSLTKVSFPHVWLTVFKGCPARKLRLHNFNLQSFEGCFPWKFLFGIFIL
jgi:hypothetical protein